MISSLGRYQIQAEIGRGAIGIVYRAHDPVLDRTVAVKTLQAGLPADMVAEMKARFVREAKSAGRLNHPNIVTIYDADVEGELAFIAMELLEGESLQQRLRAGQPLELETALDVAAQVAEGLDYAGRFGIVHRDIKPANIMLSPSGVAKITDFGLARLPASSMTQAGTVLGSPQYMAPEHIQEQPVDARADIFSLGVVLYEMLTGRTPFEDEGDADLFALLERVVKEAAPRLSLRRPELPAALDAIIERALAKQPKERYARAGQLAQALRSVGAEAAEAHFALETEPSADHVAADESLGKLLAELEASSRAQARSAEAAVELNLQLRKAFHYFEELVRQVIRAEPPFAVKLDLIYLGALPAARLSDGKVECMTRQLADNEVVDRLTFTYRMSSPRKARIVLRPEEAQALKRELERAELKFDSREVRDEAGKVRFVAFLIDAEIAAEACLRGDYEANAVEITCQNVGVLGPAKYRLSADAFDAVIWEFGQLLLGRPSRFAGLRLPTSHTSGLR
ncbi:MAG: serine/threonine-protein kinase [Burkholderiales bacterium]